MKKTFLLISALLCSSSAFANLEIVDVKANSHDKAHVAKNVLDSSKKTRWANKGESWIQFEFAGEQKLSKLDLSVFKGDERKASFNLEVSSDGQNWQKVFEAVSSGTTRDYERYNFAPVTAKFARINGFGTDVSQSWTAFYDIRFQSDDSAAVEFTK
ncbi:MULTISPECIES: discoidin domain-containing protein [unclassified Agarivorans]|uniref:discoidin domain-containing protein n=1 Tax=unclassified Agarivorans TaxID=2636026 RepID=UPI003D7C57CD